MKRGKIPPGTTRTHIFTFSLQRFLLGPPVVRHLFEVNSEPHTGARPSVRLCVGLIKNPVRDFCYGNPKKIVGVSSIYSLAPTTQGGGGSGWASSSSFFFEKHLRLYWRSIKPWSGF
jgi:hypothetical protein